MVVGFDSSPYLATKHTISLRLPPSLLSLSICSLPNPLLGRVASIVFPCRCGLLSFVCAVPSRLSCHVIPLEHPNHTIESK